MWHRHASLCLALVFGLAVSSGRARAQTPAVPPATAQAARLRVFLDCERSFCDFDYFRTEMTWVDWVRDRAGADVHVLVSTQETGAGGTEFTLAFLGQRAFEGVADTLKYVAPPSTTDDEGRRGIEQVLKVALVRFAARTPMASRIHVTVDSVASGASSAPARDPWRAWVFQLSLDLFANGSSRDGFSSTNSRASANRVTEMWKTSFNLRGSYDQNWYTLADSSKFTVIQRNYNASLLQVRSFGPHWSGGLSAQLYTSTYSNQRRVYHAAPAVEYDLFPYKESTRRQLILQYTVGPVHYDYQDTTIYNRIRETRWTQTIGAAVIATQPWGRVTISASHRNYLDNASQKNTSIGGDASWRIVKGLEFGIFGNYSKVADQIYLPRTDETDADILARVRELSIDYRYFVGVNIRYTFGSILNNIVNPRFTTGDFF